MFNMVDKIIVKILLNRTHHVKPAFATTQVCRFVQTAIGTPPVLPQLAFFTIGNLTPGKKWNVTLLIHDLGRPQFTIAYCGFPSPFHPSIFLFFSFYFTRFGLACLFCWTFESMRLCRGLAIRLTNRAG